MSSGDPHLTDLLLAGGGLQSALIALAAARRAPGLRVVIVEREPRLGGNHTWSFHESDLSPAMLEAVAPLVAARWSDSEVAFPGLERVVRGSYATILSERLDAVVRGLPDVVVRTSAEIAEVGVDGVTLAGGERLRARHVIDARGPAADRDASRTGWQKFVGLELELERPHGRVRPVLMDAFVPQDGGFRFVYTLPLAPTRVLVEDTVYADAPTLDVTTHRAAVLAYAQAQGFEVRRVLRQEQGVLPIPWGSAAPPGLGAPLVAGIRGGWFHPTTGYSLPAAARLAETLAGLLPDRYAPDAPALRVLAAEHHRQARFCRLLNRLLFAGTAPADRWHVLCRFYRELPDDVIARFYALDLTALDRARILCGRPPRGTSLLGALRARPRVEPVS